MKILGGVLLLFGIVILIGFFALLRRFKMRERGDEMLDKVIDETATEYNVPRHHLEPTKEKLFALLKLGATLFIIGLLILVFSD